jgi:hypothetical protein
MAECAVVNSLMSELSNENNFHLMKYITVTPAVT